VQAVRRRGWGCALATLPAFPAVATHQRIQWAGLEPEDFDTVSTYENSRATKPHGEYYQEILDRMGWDAARCLMVGNDVGDDMAPALALGMKAWFLDEYPENRSGAQPCYTGRGGYDALLAFFEEA
jgi:FMN phosphatase YigB (HAD superfamily)